ncbi:dynein light chain Tctex-type protein 2B-like isoform X2 [Aphidius gifuensis]|uniref:dynein light chain Tctex-type protein 2B-like isoform X2 n=1 Tax=Aphidius gifuensis TaxID=684658 RepID=UPI001CDB6CB0|nr:dynein light chain Tctex-type protein 2B-like isoform X2 [Aphidius gifuensis]
MSITKESKTNLLIRDKMNETISPETIDNVDDSDQADQQSSPETGYQMRPQLSEKFKPQVVKELIHNVLFDQLSTKKYNIEEVNIWIKMIADTIRNKVKVNVVIGEQRGAGVKMGNRCLWDAEADSYAHGNYSNETMFCVACVYAVFFY